MKRFWVSWWSGYYEDEGCTTPSFQIWISGHRNRLNKENVERDEVSICAVIDANSKDEIWNVVSKHFPDYKKRFCEQVSDAYVPSDRFPDFRNETLL